MNNSWHTTSSILYLFLNKYHNFHLSPPPPPPPQFFSMLPILGAVGEVCLVSQKLIFSRHGELSEGN